jgi:3-deoxy-D-manno-octulosonic acid kinase
VTLREARTERGGVLYDPELVSAPGEALFDPGEWQRRGALAGRDSGRGTVYYLAPPGAGAWVLRRYRRGGFVGRWIRESFLYLGAARTRGFRELELLAGLRARGLPVPRPVAAHFRRSGLRYTADLITERIAADPLSSWLARGAVAEQAWRGVGRMLARFHAEGVWHADLTAHNILLDDRGGAYLLDFDRGRIRAPGRWRGRNLARLLRSLRKIRPRVAEARYPEPQWHWLLEAYAAAQGR